MPSITSAKSIKKSKETIVHLEYEKYIGLVFSTKRGEKYRVAKFIARGGNGLVFECEDDKRNIFVVKVLDNFNSIKKENFEKEIKLQETINSPYVVKCVDSGELKAPKQKKLRPFYIMAKYNSSLEDLMKNNRLTPSNTLRYIVQLCRGLKVLHKRKEPIIHRDLKPENILYDEKGDKVLIGDFGLTHIENGSKSLNDGFVGNIDYHAPEQKIRGKAKVGTYTDIYSLGLIINAMFTNEIAQGEGYKKIWECSPFFSFLDPVVEKMIQHDINAREKDINAVLMEIEEYELDFDFTKSFFLNTYKDKNIPEDKIYELINLFSLFERLLKDKLSWVGINLNYYCDYHFSVSAILKGSILINVLFEKISVKFNNEGCCYKDNSIPYKALDLSIEENEMMYNKLLSFLARQETFEEVESKKNIIKKYFLSICDYHAKEILDSLNDIEKEVERFCIDAPILCVAYYIDSHIKEIAEYKYNVGALIQFDEYKVSEVEDKNIFYQNPDEERLNFINKIKQIIPGTTYVIKDNKLRICFEKFQEEKCFEELLLQVANKFQEGDVRKLDILEIIKKTENFGLKGVYIVDLADMKSIENVLMTINEYKKYFSKS